MKKNINVTSDKSALGEPSLIFSHIIDFDKTKVLVTNLAAVYLAYLESNKIYEHSHNQILVRMKTARSLIQRQKCKSRYNFLHLLKRKIFITVFKLSQLVFRQSFFSIYIKGGTDRNFRMLLKNKIITTFLSTTKIPLFLKSPKDE